LSETTAKVLQRRGKKRGKKRKKKKKGKKRVSVCGEKKKKTFVNPPTLSYSF
jgi:hypothetical protein